MLSVQQDNRVFYNASSSLNKCEDMKFADDIFVSKFIEENNNYKIRFTEKFFCFIGHKKALELFPSSIISGSLTVKNTELVQNESLTLW